MCNSTEKVTKTVEVRTPVDSKPAPMQIVWFNVAAFVVLHSVSIYGIYLMLFQAQWATWAFVIFYHWMGATGITAGAHRLWSHRTYKANMPLRFLLLVMNTIAFQNDVIEWARDHRVHHKYSETNADPHNAKRGFFFSHIGWLMVRKHPEVKDKGAKIDLSDLYADPMLVFQRRYYKPLMIFMCFILPTFVPTLWGESLWVSYCTAGLMRYCLTLNVTWMVNSVAHMWGDRPYDKSINPRQNWMTSFLAVGEGWHNYHHTFPQDYKTSEIPYYINVTTLFIDFFGLIGWAYDFKSVSHEIIESRKRKTG